MSRIASFLISLKARISAAPFKKAVEDPAAAQKRLLHEILERNKDTEYGKGFEFGRIQNLKDYQGNVPIIDYEDIRERINRMTRGESNILTAETPSLFAQTSGTTGEPKYIPVTPTCQKGGGTTTWFHFANTSHPKMLSGKVITIVSPAIEGYTESGIPFGSTSGMVIRELPKIVKSAYAVPYDAFEIEDYDAKYYSLLRFGVAERVTFIGTANPSSILKLAEMADRFADDLVKDIHDGTLSSKFTIDAKWRTSLEHLLKANPARAKVLEACRAQRNGKLLPADYWPDMALLGCWKGGTVGSYIDRLPGWYDPDDQGLLPIRDMGYLASEARMSIPVSDTGAGGVLSVHLNVFEFVPAEDIDSRPDDPDSWTFCGVEDVEVGSEYYTFITTTGGLYRYDMNDVIEVVGTYKQTPLIIFRRKGRGMTNLTGEKLSVNQIIEAVRRAEAAIGRETPHFRAEPDGEDSRYVIKVEFSQTPDPDSAQRFLQVVDDTLAELNIEWEGKRKSGRLKSPILQVMKPGWYDRGKQKLVSEGKRLFQAKTILLDNKAIYHPEPEETALEARL